MRERVAAASLNDRVSVHLSDYRQIAGVYDKVASIEMFEAVGEAYWPLFFNILRQRLRPTGIAALQVITIDGARFQPYRRGADFIQCHIFPGGMLPSEDALAEQVLGSGFVFGGRLMFGASYARTLACWSDAFQQAWPEIAALGFHAGFKRMWEYYLAYCEAGFRAGSIDVVQFNLTHG